MDSLTNLLKSYKSAHDAIAFYRDVHFPIGTFVTLPNATEPLEITAHGTNPTILHLSNAETAKIDEVTPHLLSDERTSFLLIKPDGLPPNSYVLHHIDTFLKEYGFHILTDHFVEIPSPTKEQAEEHYENLKGRPGRIFERNTEYLSSAPIAIALIGSETHSNVAKSLKALVGATDPTTANPLSFRGLWGHDSIEAATKENRGLRNIIHASDSEKDAKREYQIWKCSLPKGNDNTQR
jgi:nucleoside diphosphate kinase